MKYIALIFTSLFTLGCSQREIPEGTRVKASMYDAFYSFQCERKDSALVHINRALEMAENDTLDREMAVELYDDSGLYYMANGMVEEARVFQSIAVLLSESPSIPERMRNFYIGNLQKIYSELNRKDEFLEIKENSKLLLLDESISNNRYVKLYLD